MLKFTLRVIDIHIQWGAHVAPTATGYQLTATTMVPDAALELSVEQLISALNKKLFMEYTRAQSAISPTSRAPVATLTAEVQF